MAGVTVVLGNPPYVERVPLGDSAADARVRRAALPRAVRDDRRDTGRARGADPPAEARALPRRRRRRGGAAGPRSRRADEHARPGRCRGRQRQPDVVARPLLPQSAVAERGGLPRARADGRVRGRDRGGARAHFAAPRTSRSRTRSTPTTSRGRARRPRRWSSTTGSTGCSTPSFARAPIRGSRARRCAAPSSSSAATSSSAGRQASPARTRPTGSASCSSSMKDVLNGYSIHVYWLNGHYAALRAAASSDCSTSGSRSPST